MIRVALAPLPFFLLLIPALGGPLDFEAPLYSVGSPLAPVPGGTADLPFTGQDGWSASSSDSGGQIFTTAASGEYTGGQALRAADGKTVISAKSGYRLVDPATGTFTFDLLYGAAQEQGVGWWRDSDTDGLWDQTEGQLQFGVVSGSSPYQFGLRAAGFGTRVGSGVAGVAGNWYRFVVNIGAPAGGGDRVITMRVRNLTSAGEVDFNPSTPGPQAWTRTVTAAQTGSAPADAQGVFVRVSNVNTGIDNINGPPPPPEPVFATWDAGGSDTLWSTAQNWAGDIRPNTANTLLFAGDDPRGPENDFPEDTAVAGITFDSAAAAHTLSGARLLLQGPLESASAAAQTAGMDFTLGTGAVFNASHSAARIDLTGAVFGAGAFVKTGPGEVRMPGAAFWTGGTRVDSGTLSLSGILTELTGDWTVSNQSAALLRCGIGSVAEIPAGKAVLLGTTTTGTGSAAFEAAGTVFCDGSFTGSRGSTLTVPAGGQWEQRGPFTAEGIGGYGAWVNVGGLLTLTPSAQPAMFRSGVNDAGRARLIIDGGILETGRSFTVEGASVFPPRVGIGGGGVLRLLGNLPSLADGMEFLLGAGGGAVDTNGFSAGLAAPVTGEGGFAKRGAGVLTLSGAHSWDGETQVEEGRLILHSSGLADAAFVQILAAATLELSFGDRDTVGQFIAGNTSQPRGEWGAPGSGAVYESPRLAGTGRLLVTAGPTPYEHWLFQHPALNTLESHAATADPDGDGTVNLLEYALSADPSRPAALPLHTAWSAEHGLTLTVPIRAGAVFEGPGDLVSADADGLVYRVQGSADLTDFTTLEIAEAVPALATDLPALPAGWKYRTFHAVGASGRHFLRLAVSGD